MIPPREDPGQIRIASYNVRKCIGLDRRRRPDRTLEVINAIDADIVVLQEADRRLGRRPSAIPKRMLRHHSYYVPVSLATNNVSLGWHGNAILVRPSIKIITSERLDIPSFEPRGAVLAELETGAGKLRIVGLHLGLMRRHRRRQLAVLMKLLAARPKMPTVIAGDFNEWAHTRGLEPLRDQFEVHAPGKSYHASRQVAALDRIAVNARCEIVQTHVHKFGAARRASDHLPIWADLELK